VIYWLEAKDIPGYDSDLRPYGAYQFCKKCNDKQILGYTTSTAVITKEPTCVEAGTISYSAVFEYEGQTYSVTDESSIPATGIHMWNDGEITQEATCVSVGQMKYLCNTCGLEKFEDIPIDPANHANPIVVNEIMSTETEDGYSGDTVCADCNTVLSQGTVIPKSGHHWNDGIITQPPTCVTSGVKTYTCAECGENMTEEIAVDGSNHSGDTVIRDQSAATCVSEGYSGDLYCGDCGVLISKGAVTEKTAHRAGAAVIENETKAECEKAGSYDEVIYCMDCNAEIERTTKEEAALEHNWDTGLPLTEATCVSEGQMIYVCKLCGKERIETIPYSTSHSFGEWKELIAPSCTTEGSRQRICEICGLTETETVSERGHEWDSGTISIEPTPKDEGIVTYTCLYCQETKQETIAKLEAYRVIESDGESWESSDTDGYTFRINAEYVKFSELLMDGTVVDSANYSVREGSTIITLNTEYLDTLSVGNHEIEAIFTDGDVSLNLNVEKKQSNGASDNLPAVNEVYYNNEEVLTESANEPQVVAENADTADSEVEPDSNTALPEADSIAEDADEDSAISEEDNTTQNENVVSDVEDGSTMKDNEDDAENVNPHIHSEEQTDSEREADSGASDVSTMKSPKTGDDTDRGLFWVVLIVGISGIIVLQRNLLCKPEQVYKVR
jgi:hypothetical protein